MENGTVYLVEDDTALAASLIRALAKRGYDVQHFVDPQEFLTLEQPAPPCCLVLDYGLPQMNGLELQAMIAKGNWRIPIIFVTGHGGITESVLATKAGALDFLEKPYKPAVLFDRIAEAMKLSQDWAMHDLHHTTLRKNIASLTQRETELFNFLMDNPGLSASKSIARAMDISPRTADIHRARVLEKTQCQSVAEMVQKYAALINVAP